MLKVVHDADASNEAAGGSLLDEIVDAFAAGDSAGVFRAVDKVIEVGQDPRRFAEDLLERIFELGVSDPSSPTPLGEGEHRGQGLFVAKTYMAKMGGTISVHNTADGVAFTLTFQRLG